VVAGAGGVLHLIGISRPRRFIHRPVRHVAASAAAGVDGDVDWQRSGRSPVIVRGDCGQDIASDGHAFPRIGVRHAGVFAQFGRTHIELHLVHAAVAVRRIGFDRNIVTRGKRCSVQRRVDAALWGIVSAAGAGCDGQVCVSPVVSGLSAPFILIRADPDDCIRLVRGAARVLVVEPGHQSRIVSGFIQAHCCGADAERLHDACRAWIGIIASRIVIARQNSGRVGHAHCVQIHIRYRAPSYLRFVGIEARFRDRASRQFRKLKNQNG